MAEVGDGDNLVVNGGGEWDGDDRQSSGTDSNRSSEYEMAVQEPDVLRSLVNEILETGRQLSGDGTQQQFEELIRLFDLFLDGRVPVNDPNSVLPADHQFRLNRLISGVQEYYSSFTDMQLNDSPTTDIVNDLIRECKLKMASFISGSLIISQPLHGDSEVAKLLDMLRQLLTLVRRSVIGKMVNMTRKFLEEEKDIPIDIREFLLQLFVSLNKRVSLQISIQRVQLLEVLKEPLRDIQFTLTTTMTPIVKAQLSVDAVAAQRGLRVKFCEYFQSHDMTYQCLLRLFNLDPKHPNERSTASATFHPSERGKLDDSTRDSPSEGSGGLAMPASPTAHVASEESSGEHGGDDQTPAPGDTKGGQPADSDDPKGDQTLAPGDTKGDQTATMDDTKGDQTTGPDVATSGQTAAADDTTEFPANFSDLKVKASELLRLVNDKPQRPILSFTEMEIEQIQTANRVLEKQEIEFRTMAAGHLSKAEMKNKHTELTNEADGWLKALQTSITKKEKHYQAILERQKEDDPSRSPHLYKRIVLWAVTQKDLKLTDQIMVYGWFGEEWKQLALMTELNGHLKGEVMIRKEIQTLRYKYFIYSKNKNHHQHEYLAKKYRRKDLSNCDDVVTLYDGVILVEEEEQGAAGAVWSAIKNTRYRNKLNGYKQMLPDWIAEIRAGQSVEQLRQQIEEATTRQTAHCSTFAYATNEPQQDISKCRQEYLDETMKNHVDLCTERTMKPEDAYLSMLGLFEEQSQLFYTSASTQTLKDTAKFIRKNLLAIFREPSGPKLYRLSQTALDVHTLRNYQKLVFSLITRLANAKSSAWVCLLPLLHSLRGTDDKSQGSDMTRPAWSGTTELTERINQLRQNEKTKWNNWLSSLQPFFKDCTVLPYTFVELLSGGQLVDFLISNADAVPLVPLNALLNRASHHIRVATSHNEKIKVYEAVVVYLQKISNSKMPQSVDKNTVALASSFLTNFSTMEKEGIFGGKVILLREAPVAVQTHLQVLLLYERYCKPGEFMELIDRLELGLQKFTADFKAAAATKPEVIGDEEIQKWEQMFQCCDGKTPRITDLLMRICLQKFKERVMEVRPQYVTNLYLNHEFNIPEMDDVVSESALSHAGDLLTGESGRDISLTAKNQKKHYKLVDQALTKTWPADDGDPFHMVNNLIEWRNCVSICKIVWNLSKKEKEEHLSPGNVQRLTTAARHLEVVLKALADGTITYHQYEQMKKFKEKLLDFCLMSDDLMPRCKAIKQTFQQRDNELASFHSFVKSLSTFWQSCRHIIKEKATVDVWLDRDLRNLPISQLYDPVARRVVCGEIPDELRQCLSSFSILNQRRIFHVFYKSKIKMSEGNWKGVIEAYEQSAQEHNSITERLTKGTITIQEIEDLSAKYFKGTNCRLTTELPHMVTNWKTRTERLRQLDANSHIYEMSNGAEVLLELMKELKLKEGFQALERMTKVKRKSAMLKDINSDVLKSVDRIGAISQRQADCLRAFIDCKEFVDWVKKTVERKAISVFVDLVTYALGEDDLSVQKTKSLLNALDGYAPLLYVQESALKNLDNLLTLCDEVWSKEATNEELPNNLRETAEQLEFFKSVNEHYDNVELDSMSQAIAINESGVYYIGNLLKIIEDLKVPLNQEAKQRLSSTANFKLAMEDVILMKCQPVDKDGQTQEKWYTYTHLKDLQSKLTLVAGETQKDNKAMINVANDFDDMRDAVEKVAEAYIDIRREGCIQFDDLLVVVHCNPETVAVEFVLQSIGRKIFGRKSEGTSLCHCQDVFKYLDSSTKKWRKSMDDQRGDISELNYYTTEQLVILRKKLGVYLHNKKEGEPGSLDEAMPLLAMIHTITPSSLLGALLEFEKLEQQDVEDQGEEVLTLDNMTEEQEDMLADLKDIGFTEELACQALSDIGFDKEDAEYNRWLADWKKKDELRQNESEMTTDDVMKDIYMQIEREESSMVLKLESLWDGFITHTSKSRSNLLSVPHLRHLLKKLKGLRAVSKTRELPDWFDRQRPVLIAVPERNTYAMVLSIYEADRNAPAPSRNNVLICSRKTRTEEVDLFLSRALNDSESCYCIVNCHLINSDVCKVIEDRLTRTVDQDMANYGLAFIYDEKEKNTLIGQYLENRIVKNASPANQKTLNEYVTTLLAVDRDSDHTGSCLDANRLLCRLIRSKVSGVGKSLLKRNICSRLRDEKKLPGKDITIPIYKTVDTDAIISRLTLDLGNDYQQKDYNTIHLDLAYEVEKGVDELLFNLIILKSLVNSYGVVWQARDLQHYIIECTPQMTKDSCVHEMIDLLPTSVCLTPEEVSKAYKDNVPVLGFDTNELAKTEWQTVLKYIDAHKQRKFTYDIDIEPEFTGKQKALQLLLENCGLPNPTWAQLKHFVYFLYNQLKKVSTTIYCKSYYANNLRLFKPFVVGFMLQLTRDFSTSSLDIAEDSSKKKPKTALENFAIKTTWEDANYPYLFFNEDGETFTVLGFRLGEAKGDSLLLADVETNQAFKDYTVPNTLVMDMANQGVQFGENFSTLDRSTQLDRLRSIMVNKARGCTYDLEPDRNYVLTMDNAKKIAAIHQRLRVGIPVIIMGETGCGKTMLIEFMSKLQVPTELEERVKPMLIARIHGGTTEADIIAKVQEAQKLARENCHHCKSYGLDSYLRSNEEELRNVIVDRTTFEVPWCISCYKIKPGMKTLSCSHFVCVECEEKFEGVEKVECRLCKRVPKIYTVLFLDETNTTDAIGLVKEILCDGRMNGVPLDADTDLKIIAACNPYRKHKQAMIDKLKKAGLGYHKEDADVLEKLGDIPLRHLVYRVHALPQSLLPLVWDFGTLKSADYSQRSSENPENVLKDVESRYIIQMIDKFESTNKERLKFRKPASVAMILSRSQTFMRKRDDECSFISLRDIKRLLQILEWFHQHRKVIFPAMQTLSTEVQPEPVLLSLLLAIGVCYLTRLEEPTRVEYAECISRDIEILIGQPRRVKGSKLLQQQMQICEEMFVNEVVDNKDHQNIAKNKSLMENIFMMIVCIENRIPLFVIGKPGSSKSLAKTLIYDAMKMTGPKTKSTVLQELKKIYMASFQCSRHATTAGIVKVFTHCQGIQQGKEVNLEKFVTVVVLDEVGLAEDSENMPLKVLHSLLEVENDSEGNISPKKCGFIGISNWALDPAKMNRGMFMQRGSFDKEELLKIGREICVLAESDGTAIETGSTGDTGVTSFVPPLAAGFIEICQSCKPMHRNKTEFFGLRDYYSLIKMVANFARLRGELSRAQLVHSIKRNFGGLDSELVNPMDFFDHHCGPLMNTLGEDDERDPPTDSIGLIDSCLGGQHTNFPGIESRYQLILAENLSVLSIIQDRLSKHDIYPEVVFGSKFPDDVSYTQVCHNISKIKMRMELGKPVILLNLDELYESLYDTLNQYFTVWGDRKFVDIGLGTHRVKVLVKEGFRLIVIAGKEKVYTDFPIPLINRFEKHYVSASTLLTRDQLKMKIELEKWMNRFVSPDETLNEMECKCDGCQLPSRRQYQLHCDHNIGTCCKEKIESGAIRRVCPVERCADMITQQFDWEDNLLDEKSRQYFENTSISSAFIGYSTELTALAITEAEEEDSPGSLHEKAKHRLLQCATGESVLRLDKTLLRHEAINLQDIYFYKQHHETLIQYLNYQLPLAGQANLLIQVTTFSQLMSRADVANLHSQLNSTTQYVDMRCLQLQDFNKKSQFTEALKKFYGQESTFKSKLMIVQCESIDRNLELLETVRYIIQDESRKFVAQDVPNHTVLLLSLPRGRDFKGYQGGAWRCVHIDDPRLRMFKLPSLNECMMLKPSNIIGQLLRATHAEGRGKDQEPPPPESDTGQMNECDSSYGIQAEMRFAVDGILPFVKHCIPAALSLIKSPQQNNRVKLLSKLIDLQDSHDFTHAFLRLLRDLMTEQDEVNQYHWVKEDAVKASNMKTSETLRHAVEDALQRALVPCMAAIFSFIDVQHNLSLLSDNTELADLWLQIFNVSHKLGLRFDKLTGAGQMKLQRAFKVHAASKGQMDFVAKFPFSWKVKESVESLQAAEATNPLTMTDKSPDLLDKLFEEMTPCGQVLREYMKAKNSLDLVNRYIHDFVYMSHPCRSETEHQIVQKVIRTALRAKYGETEISLVLIHVTYKELKPMLDNLAAILNIVLVTDKVKPIIEQVADYMDSDESAGSMPCDLVAISFCLKALLSSARIRNIQKAPQEWIGQMDQVEVMSEIFSNDARTDKSSQLAKECRSTWLHLQVKKIYTEYVILPSTPDSKTKERNSFRLRDLTNCTDAGNFQSNETFQKVVGFLTGRVWDGIRALYPNCPPVCPACNEDLYDPVMLPCTHLLCVKCSKHITKCADGSCKATIVPSQQYSPEDHVKPEALQVYKDLRKRLNKFFMCYTSTLVFASSVRAPDDKLIKLLISRVFTDEGTREFSFYNSHEAVDSNPVLRSFLLKLLLKYEQSETIRELLDQVMATWSQHNMGGQLHTVTMLMDCYKDIHEKGVRYELPASIAELAYKAEDVTWYSTRDITVEALQTIAGIQCHISNIVGNMLCTQCTQLARNRENDVRLFFEQMAAHGNSQPGYFVVRHLLQKKGMSYIKDLLTTPRSYLIPAEIREVISSYKVPDILAVYGGEAYRKAVDNVSKVIRCTGDASLKNHVDNLYQHTSGSLLPQTLFTKVTRSFRQGEPVPDDVRHQLMGRLGGDSGLMKRTSGSLLSGVMRYFRQEEHVPDDGRIMKEICQMLLDPDRIPQGMDAKSSQGVSIAMLVLHLLSVAEANPDDLTPLVEIVTKPKEAVEHDTPGLERKEEALPKVTPAEDLLSYGSGAVVYCCPKGHSYLVEESGRPSGTAKCRCGAEFDEAWNRDGFTIGAQSSNISCGQKLSITAYSVLKCLTHLFMYTSAILHPEQIWDMIASRAGSPADLERLLYDHVERDLEQISQCCEVSTDDCILLLHDIINNMTTRALGSRRREGGSTVLATVAEKRKWESAFNDRYLKPTLDKQNEVINRLRGRLLSPIQNSLTQMLEASTMSIDADNPLASPGLWLYKSPLTLTTIQNSIQNEDFPHLARFVYHCEELIAIRDLPDILTLTQLLSDKFHSKFTRSQAKRIGIDEFCTEYDNEGLDLRGKMSQFTRAWNTMVQGRYSKINLPKLSENPPLAEFLFDSYSLNMDNSQTKTGAAPFILTTFLVNTHNEMLEIDDKERSVIDFPAAITSNFVSLSNQDEIVDLVQSHSEYELRGTAKMSYDWAAIEKELILRYIGRKPIILLTAEHVPAYLFQEDFSLLKQLRAIGDTQERMTPELEASITNTLTTNIQTLKDYLKELQVIINFLSAMSHIEKDNSLADYAGTALGKDGTTEYLTPEVKLKHVKHVWFVLKYTQAGQETERAQEPFDDAELSYRMGLSDDLKDKLKTRSASNSSRVKLLLQLLFEYIVLKLSRAATKNGMKKEPAKKSLHEALNAYIVEQNDESLMRRAADLPALPPDLLVGHATQAWGYIRGSLNVTTAKIG